MKDRLIAGTINRYEPEDGYRNWHLDSCSRMIWSAELEIGVLPDWVLPLGSPTFMLHFRPEMFDEIRCHHVLEHLTPVESQVALADFLQILRPGGLLDVQVPDVEKVIEAYARDELTMPDLNQWLFGEQLVEHEPGDSHRQAFTATTLRAALAAEGFTDLEVQEAGYSAHFHARKPE